MLGYFQGLQSSLALAISSNVLIMFYRWVAIEDAPMTNTERIIRLKTVLDRTGLSRSTIYRKIAEGTFPPQVKISVHGAGWHESAINRWIADPTRYCEEGSEK
jgi:prophage regulatory protein